MLDLAKLRYIHQSLTFICTFDENKIENKNKLHSWNWRELASHIKVQFGCHVLQVAKNISQKSLPLERKLNRAITTATAAAATTYFASQTPVAVAHSKRQTSALEDFFLSRLLTTLVLFCFNYFLLRSSSLGFVKKLYFFFISLKRCP